MLMGLVVANFVQPGVGLNKSLKNNLIDQFQISSISLATGFETETFLLHIVPNTFLSAFAEDNLLSVLFVSSLFGFGLLTVAEKAKPVNRLLEQLSSIFFIVMNWIIKIAPLGALATIAYRLI